MEIEFDPAKDQINRQKHGVSLAVAAEMDLGQATVIEDDRFDYGETRFVAFGPLGGGLYAMCFTMRGEVVRVIGLRRANRRERKRYGQSG